MGNEIPNNWEVAPLGDLLTHTLGGDWGKALDFVEPEFTEVFCIRASELRRWDHERGASAALRKVKKTSLLARRLVEGDIIVEISGGGPEQPVGRTALIDSSVLTKNPDIPKICTNFFRQMRPSKWINSRYLSAFLSYFYKSGKIAEYQAGSNNLRNLRFNDYLTISIPIPPFAEQCRIIEKIDELSSELDNGIESLKAARDQLKVYRQSLLKSAFEGKMTSQWRDDNRTKLEPADQLLIRIKRTRDAKYQKQLMKWKIRAERGEGTSKPRPLNYAVPFSDEEKEKFVPLPDNWRWAKIGDLFGVYVGATPSRQNSRYWGGSINWVSSGEVRFHRISSTREQISLEGLENTSTECHPPGTVMLAMIGEGKTRGQAAILEIDACHNQNTAAIRVSETDCLPDYLYYYLFFQYQITRTLGSGNNQKALNKDRVSNMCFPLAPVKEQRELVAGIETGMSVIDQVEEDIKLEIRKAEVLRQSILKKAFSGKLVAQGPSDELASVLLERIRGKKAETENSKRKIKRRAAA